MLEASLPRPPSSVPASRISPRGSARPFGRSAGSLSLFGRAPAAAGRLWICPGPEWDGDHETCGRALTHDGRCDECSHRRMQLRKAARRARERQAEAAF